MKNIFYKVKGYLDKLHNSYAFHHLFTMPLIYLLIFASLILQKPEILTIIFWWMLFFLPFILLPVSAVVAAVMWREYKRAQVFFEKEYIVLEVKIPRDTIKSPKSMAVALNGIISGPWEATFLDVWLRGKTRPRYSFELVSIEGKIHFYIHLEKKLKDYVLSHIYGQYPDVEIEEVQDYTEGIKYDEEKISVWAFEYVKGKPDPYPIKTYVEFQTDKEVRDEKGAEERTDPLAGVFEFFSTIGPGEQLWLQFVVRRNRDLSFGVWPFKVEYSWHKAAQKQIDAIYDSLIEEQKDGVVKKGKSQLTPAQEEEVQALARTLHADGIDVGIRVMYLARKGAGRPQYVISPGLVKLWREFRTPNLNALIPYGGIILFDYPWQFESLRLPGLMEEFVDAYRRRSFYFPPHQHKYSIYSVAELATLYHFPSMQIKTPGMPYIDARKANIPENLPT